MGGRKQLIGVFCTPALGRVTGFTDLLEISGPAAVKTLAGVAVIGQLEHVTP